MHSGGAKKLTALAFVAVLASALTIGLTPSYAQKHGGGGHGGESTGHSAGGCGDSGGGGCSGDEGGHKGGKGPRGSGDMGHGGSGQSLRDVFHGLDAASETEHSGGDEHSGSSKKGGVAGHGKHGSTAPKDH